MSSEEEANQRVEFGRPSMADTLAIVPTTEIVCI